MYRVAVKKDFIAPHYLIGGDWAAENDLHAHHYRIEVLLEGNMLDQHGYLVDIVDIEKHLEGLVTRFNNQTLNDFRCEWSLHGPHLPKFQTRVHDGCSPSPGR